MKRNSRNIVSIKELMTEISFEAYTRQTLVSLFRSFLETIIENRYESVVLVKLSDTSGFESLLSRLNYTGINVYNYSGQHEGFNNLEVNLPQMENDEFLVVIAERFSACIYWNSSSLDVSGFSEGFCSLNPSEVKKIVDYMQTVAFSEDLEKDLSKGLQDRRNNEKFTTIIRKLVADLENRQRDLICANTELKDLSEKSDESDKLASVSQFFSTTMHELRNPLGVIDLHSKVIAKNIEIASGLDKETSDRVQESAQIISKTSKVLEKILTELIDFSKPLSLEKKQDSVEESVKEIIALIKPSYEAKNVELLFDNSLEEQVMINFDRAKIHQVLFNLLKNALEVSNSGSKVEVLLENNEAENNICLKVSDEGQGIPKENQEKIFEPYFTTKKEGTGVGLAQARKIIQAHDGQLFVDSAKTKGTTFILLLPAKSLHVNTL